jgi:serine/threonine protein phosphatase PrpC
VTLLFDCTVIGREDRAAYFATEVGGVLVVADGAGGTSHGALAAEAVISAVAANLALRSGEGWMNVLVQVDRALRSGETTAVVASIVGDEIFGASVGDSGAWLIDANGHHVLTHAQQRKPLVGTGRATPVPFMAHLGAGTLLLATDGLLNYAPAPRIAELAIADELAGLAARLGDLPRLRSGALPDDVAVLLARASA